MLDIFTDLKAAEVLIKGLRGDRRHIAPYPFVPDKPWQAPQVPKHPLPRSFPEAEGVSSAHIERFFRELDSCSDIRVHSAVVLRHGKLIAQGHWKPYTGIYAQMVYSLSKTVTAMAVGMAIEEGLFSLDDSITELFSDVELSVLPALRKNKLSSVTVRHLLNMTAGVRFNEVGSILERDWIRAFLSSDCIYEPGTEFLYNSMNSYLLGALVCRKSGQGLVEYLTPRLFEPLGIESVRWEKCPMGIEKGGWGLFLRPEDMAKLGQLYLQKGVWNTDGEERRLLSEKWIEESTDMNIQTTLGEHKTAYGYHVWQFPIANSYQFNGVFGQYVVVIPQIDVVIALTGGSHGLFLDESGAIIETYFGDSSVFSDSALPQRPEAVRSLQKTLSQLALFPDTVPVVQKKNLWQKLKTSLHSEPSPELSPDGKLLNGRSYTLQNSYGTILPFIFSVERDSFLPPTQRVSFVFERDCCTVRFEHDQGALSVRAGLDGEARRNVLNINGEAYGTGSVAKLTRDEDDRPVLKLYVSFLETPNTRVIKFIFSGERLLIRFQEIPTVEDTSKLLMHLVKGGDTGKETLFIEKMHQDRLAGYARRITVPKARGQLERTEPKETQGQNNEQKHQAQALRQRKKRKAVSKQK